MSLVCKSVIGCKITPIERVLVFPRRRGRTLICRRKQVKIGAIDDPILILQEKGSYLIPRLIQQPPHSGGGIDCEIWVPIQPGREFIQVVFAAKMRPYDA